jgi:hypothetical protein
MFVVHSLPQEGTGQAAGRRIRIAYRVLRIAYSVVRGPVDFSALRRLAMILAWVVIVSFPNLAFTFFRGI